MFQLIVDQYRYLKFDFLLGYEVGGGRILGRKSIMCKIEEIDVFRIQELSKLYFNDFEIYK